jgi:hypothetical protein
VKILFITNKYGDLGNRLFRFARIYSALYPYKIFIVDISFYQFAYFYNPKNIYYWILFRILGFISNKSFSKIQCLINKNKLIHKIVTSCMLSNNKKTRISNIKKTILDSPHIFLKIDCSELISDQSFSNDVIKSKLKNIFRIKRKYTKIASKIIKKDKNVFYLGVHIRRGDYKEFWGGKWYFEDDIYIQNIKILLEGINFNKNVKIVLVSNEFLNTQNWKEFDFIYIPQSCPVVDQKILKKCDSILASCSSFSAWPAFIENIPFALVNAKVGFDWKKFYVPSEYMKYT